PSISNLITNPAIMNDTLRVQSGATLSISASLEDETALEELELKVIRVSDGKEMWEEIQSISGTVANLNKLIAIESAWGTGLFDLEIHLLDQKGNQAKEEILLWIEP
ncbi:MAG: hypothetical protein LPK45_08585, partial [Bacteroidota bacterium]|nr:hypothetical protein [Bacteroidota bacterium]MDX5431132.1 hypothetical protein [Bacteroidota bacterium]MDX5469879.1 hypothetical protein [Bacteroidota bacterium]